MTAKFHRDFAADLAAIPDVVSTVSDRVYPLIVQSDAELPAIAFTIQDGTTTTFYVNSFGLTTYSIQVDIFSRDYGVNQIIVESIMSRYNGKILSIGSSSNPTLIQRALIENSLNFIDPEDPGIFRSTVEILITTE